MDHIKLLAITGLILYIIVVILCRSCIKLSQRCKDLEKEVTHIKLEYRSELRYVNTKLEMFGYPKADCKKCLFRQWCDENRPECMGQNAPES